MASDRGELPPSLIDVATERATQIERAVSHVARAVELELADIALTNGNLDDETRAKLAKLGEQLVKISRGADYLLGGIARTSGVVLETNAPYLEQPIPSVEPTQERQLPPTAPAHAGIVETPAAPAEDTAIVRFPVRLPLEPRQSGGEQAARREPATERDEREGELDLYARIVDVSRTPKMAPKEGVPIIELSIQDNTTLAVGERTLELSDHERYLFNALIILRDKPRPAGELKGFGFYPDAKTSTANQALSKEMGALSAKLNKAAGIEIIKYLGERMGRRYAVNPNVVLKDLRTDEQRAEVVEVKKK